MTVTVDQLHEALECFGERTALSVVRELAEQAPGISGALLARAMCRSSWQIGLELGLRIGVMDRIGAEEALDAIRVSMANRLWQKPSPAISRQAPIRLASRA